MKNQIFTKRNIFTCVMFGAIFLFVLIESICFKTNLSAIAFIIAVPVFILSLLKIATDILEDINDKETNYLIVSERNHFIFSDYDTASKIRNCDDQTVNDIIKTLTDKNQDSLYVKESLSYYYKIFKSRCRVRKVRRCLLYFYYATFLLVFVLLLLHMEITAFLSNTLFSSLNTDLLSVWTLIIILFEIMMKPIFEKWLTCLIKKKIGIDIDDYAGT